MKKIIFLMLAIYFLPKFSTAQKVQLMENNTIEIRAAKATIPLNAKSQIGMEISNYDVYEIDLQRLSAYVQQQAGRASLSFHFPRKKEVELTLFENDMRAQNYKSMAMTDQGEVQLSRQECTTFEGYTREGQPVRMNISVNEIKGYIKLNDDLLWIESASNYDQTATDNLILVFNDSDFTDSTKDFCGVSGKAGKKIQESNSNNLNAGGFMGCFLLELATEADHDFYEDEDNNTNQANQKILEELNIVEGFYYDNFFLEFSIVFQRVWTTSDDPYDEVKCEIVDELAAEWNTNMTHIQRDLVHLWSGAKHKNILGCVQELGAVCTQPLLSYGFTDGLRPKVTAHEIGHQFNANHDLAWCGLFTSNTIMCSGGFKNWEFSTDNFNQVVNHMNANSACLDRVNGLANVQGFEVNLGAWTQDDEDEMDWTRHSGSTPTSGTGPSGAYNDQYYLYTEGSGNNNKEANLVSPDFEICHATNSLFSFGYHLYGADMGRLNVDVKKVDGSEWTTVWTRSGNLGDFWQTASVDLSDYFYDKIQIRFNARTGDGNLTDMAIDDVVLSSPCELTIDPPFLEFPQAGGSLTFSVSAGAGWEANVASGSSWISVSPANGAGFQFVTVTCPANNSNAGRNGSVLVSCGGAVKQLTVVQAGITIEVSPCGPGYANIPENQSFETQVFPWTQDSDDDLDWTRTDEETPSQNTGPASAYDGDYYMYVESSFPNFPSKEANLLSPCFNLAEVPAPEISFAYHMYGNHMGRLRLQVSTNDGFGWSTLWSKQGDQGDTWHTETIDLSAYNYAPIRLRFNGSTGSSFQSDIAIDAVNVTAGGCYDQYEDNNTPATAHATTMGPSISLPGACLSEGDNDYYRFFYQHNGLFINFYIRVIGKTSETTGDYRLTVDIVGNSIIVETHPENGSTTDTYLYLYDSDATTILGQDDNSGVGLFSKIQYNMPGFIPDTGEENSNTKLALSNSPNPFSQKTTFSFYLETEKEVELIITDINGKVLARPVEGAYYSVGTHLVEFDAGDFVNGIYFYTLKTKSEVMTKRMVISR